MLIDGDLALDLRALADKIDRQLDDLAFGRLKLGVSARPWRFAWFSDAGLVRLRREPTRSGFSFVNAFVTRMTFEIDEFVLGVNGRSDDAAVTNLKKQIAVAGSYVPRPVKWDDLLIERAST